MDDRNKLPAHFTLKLGVELNQIFLLRLRTPVVGLKLFNIFLGDLLHENQKAKGNRTKSGVESPNRIQNSAGYLLVHSLEEVPQVVNHISRKILMR